MLVNLLLSPFLIDRFFATSEVSVIYDVVMDQRCRVYHLCNHGDGALLGRDERPEIMCDGRSGDMRVNLLWRVALQVAAIRRHMVGRIALPLPSKR